MNIRQVKRWQWALIGLLVGVLIAHSRTWVDPTQVGGKFARSISQERFEETVHRSAGRAGYREVQQIAVEPLVNGNHLVILQLTSGDMQFVEAKVPYEPVLQSATRARPGSGQSTVLDFLADMAASPGTELNVVYRWWRGQVAWTLIWVVGGVVVIGEIWPSVIRMLLGPPVPSGPTFDLPATSVKQKPTTEALLSGLTGEQHDHLRKLEAELERNIETGEPAEIRSRSENQGIPKMMLSDAPYDPSVIQTEQEDKQFKGEYYPVARSKRANAFIKPSRDAFTIVELLIVIGLIALLIALLFPAIQKARAKAVNVQCLSNMRQVGLALLMYANDNKGWICPAHGPGFGGVGAPLDRRWPCFVFKPPVWNPKILTCPVDQDPLEEHTYVLNHYLWERGITLSTGRIGRLTPSDIIVMGEKYHDETDYFMVSGDYERIVDPHKHGIYIGSAHLYLDFHADFARPQRVTAGVDPWDIQ